jgi:DNA-binding transcriptional ArsR family regulator
MDGEVGKLDRLTLKSLASDAKIGILQRLAERRKTPSELSKEISAAPSTIVEHLKELEASGLVRRQDTKHKWIYYELTDKGANIFKPRIPFHLMLSLALAIVITGIGAWSYFSLPQHTLTAAVDAGMKEEMRAVAAEAVATGAVAPLNDTITQSNYTTASDSGPLFAAVAVIGALISIGLLYTIYKARKQFR